MEGLVSFDTTVRVESGQKIRCQGCQLRRGRAGAPICTVPRDSVGAARRIPSETSATPGWGAFLCKECGSWTEFRITAIRSVVAA